jgi:NADPH2:quinone reductase
MSPNSFSFVGSRIEAMTFHPFEANSFAVARPKPEELPVMKIVLIASYLPSTGKTAPGLQEEIISRATAYEKLKAMKAAWYERQGAARDVLVVGEMEDPQPSAGDVRIRVAFSGVNPGDVKKREDAFGVGMPFPRVIPHSDGSGTVDAVGEGVSREWIGRHVWCYGAQSYRPFGTAAGYTVVPLKLVVQLPERVPLEQGACLGIPGITAHRAVQVAGSVKGKTVLVQGGAGSVGACAVQVAHQAGARVIATCRAESDKEIASRAGADEVLLTAGNLAERIRALAPDGVDHVVEVAFGSNIKTDTEVLAQGGSVATYATNTPMPEIPVWQLVFVNASLFFVGSDDVPADAKIEATHDINKALETGWKGLDIAEIVPLEQIAHAYELVEHPVKPGRVVVAIT